MKTVFIQKSLIEGIVYGTYWEQICTVSIIDHKCGSRVSLRNAGYLQIKQNAGVARTDLQLTAIRHSLWQAKPLIPDVTLIEWVGKANYLPS